MRGPGEARPRLQRVIDACRESGVRVRAEPRDELTRLAKTAGHQGVVAIVRGREMLEMEDLFEAAGATVFVGTGRDGRSAEPGGVAAHGGRVGRDGVVVTERRAAPLSAVAVKASAGAAEHVRIARVVNLVRALEQIKEQNIWCVGLDERGSMDYDEYDFTSST